MMNLSQFNWQHQNALFKPLLAVVVLGLIMVGTASTSIAVSYERAPYYFMVRQLGYALVGMVAFYIASIIPTHIWQRFNAYFWALAVVALVLVFVPGIGHEVNGSRRWLNFVVIKVQASEIAKLASVIYIASFLVRRQGEVVQSWKGFYIPLGVTSLMIALLLAEPDFGAAFVLVGAVLIQLFLGGVKAGQFFLLVIVAFILGAIALSFESYRVERLLAYLDPWAPENVYDIGYQLTQSLIAFGRGGLFGVGLGESIQKLFYLPEAHTDFVFAIWAEETGLVGALLALGLLVWLVARALRIVWQAQAQQQMFAAYVGIGIVALFCLQIVINVGVNTGLLPTKGLTLPFYSYGGSSLIVCCGMVGMLARIAYESNAATEPEDTSQEQEVSYA